MKRASPLSLELAQLDSLAMFALLVCAACGQPGAAGYSVDANPTDEVVTDADVGSEVQPGADAGQPSDLAPIADTALACADKVCDDGNPCTDDSCDPATVLCIAHANTAPCDDGDDCSVADACKDGACGGVSAPDATTCTADGKVGACASGACVPNPKAVSVVAGRFHTCAVLSDGTAACWGLNTSGQVGDGSKAPSVATPTKVAGLSDVAAIAAGWAHTCAVLAGGAVSCWGANDVGQLGDGSMIDKVAPSKVQGLLDATAIAAGYAHACALLGGGKVSCWGENSKGQLGDGSNVNKGAPSDVKGLAGAIAIAAGLDHTCALLAGGKMRCWGYQGSGKLGAGLGTPSTTTPVQVLNIPGEATAIAAGAYHTCAVLGGGLVYCWGGNSLGELGNGTKDSSNFPHLVPGVSGAVAIAAGNGHSCAVLAGGKVSCWGWNVDGQLGDGSKDTMKSLPTTVVGLAGAVAIAAGHTHTCALVAGGGVSCWGANHSGQLGDGSLASTSLPVKAVGIGQ